MFLHGLFCIFVYLFFYWCANIYWSEKVGFIWDVTGNQLQVIDLKIRNDKSKKRNWNENKWKWILMNEIKWTLFFYLWKSFLMKKYKFENKL